MPVFLLLSVGFAAAIVSLLSQNEYDACAPSQPKHHGLIMSYVMHYFGKKTPATTSVKLPDMKAYKKIKAKEKASW
jgi:hypothetical protein